MALRCRIGSKQNASCSKEDEQLLCCARFGLLPGHFCLGLQPVIEFVSVSSAPLFVKVVSAAANILVHFDELGLQILVLVGY